MTATTCGCIKLEYDVSKLFTRIVALTISKKNRATLIIYTFLSFQNKSPAASNFGFTRIPLILFTVVKMVDTLDLITTTFQNNLTNHY